MSDLFTILIHPRLLSALRKSPPGLNRRLQKTCERLQLGYWDNGTRVKLLKGVNKAVYEARVTRAIRLLFTVARAPNSRPPFADEPCIIAWDMVGHDDLDRAGRLNHSAEAGFLDFEEVGDFTISGPPAAAGAEIDPTDGVATARRRLADRQAKTVDDELRMAIRWYQLDPDVVLDDAQWQALFDADAAELELKLSQTQAQTVFAAGPVVLRGAAGSGKTTISVYRLGRGVSERPDAAALYVTYSAELLQDARRLFNDLLRTRHLPQLAVPPVFLTFPELYQQLGGVQRPWSQLVRYAAFAHWYRMIYGVADAALVWEEIRGIIKGACDGLAVNCLSADAYFELGRKRAPLQAEQRPRIYRVFQHYQDWCRSQRRFDDIDLARWALRALDKHHRQPPYDLVIVDECQDLTELEQRLLRGLCRSPAGLFVAGDPQQIVNPSGFRWAELRDQLRAADGRAPEIRTLGRNYRSVDRIVELANSLLTVQQARTGRSDDDAQQDTVLRGAVPLLIEADADALRHQLTAFGPDCAVIVPGPEAADTWRELLGSERVFDVSSCKGLEFDTCVLVGFFADEPALWRRLLLTEEPLKEDAAARRILRQLYVAVTRARRYLAVCEPTAELVGWWQSKWFRSRLEHDAAEALQCLVLSAGSPAEWQRQGDYFLSRRRFLQAAECFRLAGDHDRERLATAGHCEDIEAFADAADIYAELARPAQQAACLARTDQQQRAAQIFADLADWQQAAPCFEAAGALSAAAKAYRLTGDIESFRRCQLAHLVAERRWQQAGKLAARLTKYRDAIDYYQRAGADDQVARVRQLLAEQAAGTPP